MDLKSLLSDVHEILADVDAGKGFDSLSNREIYALSIQVDRRNVYFILHHKNEKGYVEKSLVVYENRLTAGDFEARESMEDVDSTLWLVI